MGAGDALTKRNPSSQPWRRASEASRKSRVGRSTRALAGGAASWRMVTMAVNQPLCRAELSGVMR